MWFHPEGSCEHGHNKYTCHQQRYLLLSSSTTKHKVEKGMNKTFTCIYILPSTLENKIPAFNYSVTWKIKEILENKSSFEFLPLGETYFVIFFFFGCCFAYFSSLVQNNNWLLTLNKYAQFLSFRKDHRMWPQQKFTCKNKNKSFFHPIRNHET